MTTKITTDEVPDALNPPVWWVRCHDYGDTWEMAYQVRASSSEEAVDHWATETDGEDHYLAEGKHSVFVEVVSHEDYLNLTDVEKEGCNEPNEEAVKIHRYEVRGELEPTYYIKER